ncbi:virulence factor Mce-like protein [Nocardia transvalensis]|uniref:Virulence factor Mce-like protein n=1 Tax=Nocardia transvalensis TaxID=37333 RepID=A0A7W9PGC3_9NOCA|nr:MCE family protein [Nocardia transvalensis]MBB5915415.1 virulence factor Mce-like protein [Nocardia transvalensis]
MSIAFESDGKVLANWNLLLRGLAFLAVVAVVGGLMLARSQGVFEKTVRVTAELVNVGDGLPAKSDVKYQGVVVGQVDSVSPSTDGGPNHVHIDLKPGSLAGIPATVTARVVPSNVFAVPSIQLVYNGRGSPLAAGARIPEDRSQATVRLQTSLTALSRIAAAAGRSSSDPALGILAVVERATAGHGEEAVRAGAELTRIAQAFNAAMAPDGTGSTVDALSNALAGLRTSAPDLLGAVHNAVGPMRAVAESREQLANLLSAGLATSSTVAGGLENRVDTITGVTGKIGPVLGTLGDGSANFAQMATSQTQMAYYFKTLWDEGDQNMTAKIILELTPHRQYTRADCPRYGTLAGPSCTSGPPGNTTIIGPNAAPGAVPTLIGGNVGEIGSRQEQERIAALLGIPPNAANDLLFGPLLRGNDATATPAPAAPAAPAPLPGLPALPGFPLPLPVPAAPAPAPTGEPR